MADMRHSERQASESSTEPPPLQQDRAHDDSDAGILREREGQDEPLKPERKANARARPHQQGHVASSWWQPPFLMGIAEPAKENVATLQSSGGNGGMQRQQLSVVYQGVSKHDVSKGMAHAVLLSDDARAVFAYEHVT